MHSSRGEDVSSWRSQLKSALGPSVVLDADLSREVSFRIGGPADAFLKATSCDSLSAGIRIAKNADQAVTLLGGGTNVLVSDRGIRGLTIRLSGELAKVQMRARGAAFGLFYVGAGALNPRAVSFALDESAVGIEFLATVPGTFGGALIMNAGAHGAEISSFIRSVEVLNSSLEVEKRSKADCSFSYRTSGFGDEEIILSADLEIPWGDAQIAKEKLKQMRVKRRATQPLGEPNAGSIFKNPAGDYAGRLIEACGLKGERLGAAQISTKHANFIVNCGGATAKEVASLAQRARLSVQERFDISLEWEVKRLGDWEDEPS